MSRAPHWQRDPVMSGAGAVVRISTALELRDRLGHWRVRWGIGRRRLRVPPGVYAVGAPTAGSPVLVTANFKMSFDLLRASLAGRDAWVLVLDTHGINVWCAAGKGTFGTDELVARADAVRLSEIVSHRKLIVPQLGAPGVSAHRVRALGGWRVVFGPVRAADLPAFLDAGLRATPEMRRVRFPLPHRMALIPVELIDWGILLLAPAAGLVLLAGFGPDGYSWRRALQGGWSVAAPMLAAYVAGAALAPALLPWLPGRSFSVKGLWAGLAVALVFLAVGPFANWADASGWLLLIPAIASFLAMNFTGASTYTSLSGVRREMKAAVPVQAVAAGLGVALWLVGRFV